MVVQEEQCILVIPHNTVDCSPIDDFYMDDVRCDDFRKDPTTDNFYG
jgi:hypothetical protein